MPKDTFLQQNETGNILFPFTIDSDRLAGKPLVCSKQLRLLPGKRLVCQASYAGANALVKIFFGSSYQRHWSREVRGVEHLCSSGLRTPRLLESWDAVENNFAIIIFEFIEGAKTLDEIRQEDDFFNPEMGFFEEIVTVVARMHDASIYQKDIHFDNFLVAEGKVYLIDGDQIFSKRGRSGLPSKLAGDNLAMFFAQLYPWQDGLIESLFNSYLGERELPNPSLTLPSVKRELQACRARREKKYLTKIFRTCSAFDVIKSWKTYCVFSRDFGEQNANRFIEDPDLLIENGEILKSGRTATVAKINLSGVPYIVKRYNKKSAHHQIARSLIESRSAVSWRNGHLLKFNGIPTAEPLLMLEQRVGPMRGRSFVVTEYRPGLHAFDYFQAGDSSSEAKGVAKKIVKLVQSLHRCQLVHGDLKAHNIWITGTNPILIDLDGMKKINGNGKKLIAKDWSRLKRDLGDSQIAEVLFKQHADKEL